LFGLCYWMIASLALTPLVALRCPTIERTDAWVKIIFGQNLAACLFRAKYFVIFFFFISHFYWRHVIYYK
jgi:hypothetical protein